MFSLAERVAAARPPTWWIWYHESKGDGQRAAFMDIAAQRAGAKHASELTTLLLLGQLGAAVYAGLPRRTTMATFLNSTSCVDSKLTRAGICGRLGSCGQHWTHGGPSAAPPRRIRSSRRLHGGCGALLVLTLPLLSCEWLLGATHPSPYRGGRQKHTVHGRSTRTSATKLARCRGAGTARCCRAKPRRAAQ